MRKWIRPYLGAGLGYTSYKEDIIETSYNTGTRENNNHQYITHESDKIEGNSFSFLVQTGVLFKLGPVVIDLSANYRSLKVQPEEVEVNLGGFTFAVGFGFCFGK